MVESLGPGVGERVPGAAGQEWGVFGALRASQGYFLRHQELAFPAVAERK